VLSSVLARLPLGISSYALLILVRERTGSFATAGAAVGAYAITGALVGPLLGTAVDRGGQRRVLLGGAIVNPLLLVVVILVAGQRPPAAIMILTCALAGAAVPPVAACMRVLWSTIAPEPAARLLAHSLEATLQDLIWILGPLVVAAAVLAGAPAAAVIASAAMTASGTIWFTTSPLSRAWRGAGQARPRRGALTNPQLRIVLVSVVLMGVYIGAYEVGLPARAVDAGHTSAAGLLIATWSLGSLAGGVLYARHQWRGKITERYPRLLAGIALLGLPLLLVSGVGATAILSVLAGLGSAPALSCQYSLVGALAPAGTAAEAFTWSSSCIFGGIAAGNAIAGSLVQGASPARAFVLGSAAVAGAAVIVALARRGMP
jgi:MFS family permease